jgi:transposase-like protein
MARVPDANNPACPHCGAAHVIRNGRKGGRQRFRCRDCGRTFGPTFGTPPYGLRHSAEGVARALLVVMRRGSLSAAEEVTGHKYETLGLWLRRAGGHAEALTQALVHDLELSTVEVDAFWSFVQRSAPALAEPGSGRTRRPPWAAPAAAPGGAA